MSALREGTRTVYIQGRSDQPQFFLAVLKSCSHKGHVLGRLQAVRRLCRCWSCSSLDNRSCSNQKLNLSQQLWLNFFFFFYFEQWLEHYIKDHIWSCKLSWLNPKAAHEVRWYEQRFFFISFSLLYPHTYIKEVIDRCYGKSVQWFFFLFQFFFLQHGPIWPTFI